MTAYYNENDKYAAQWLRNLIEDGLIPWGYVDERSILEVKAEDLAGYDQCHFFAGLGGWSRALRLAGWPDDRPVWTGSAPCQPFSVAGKSLGTADERHLWPALSTLIRECCPPTFFGEQVARAIGMGWFDTVAADLEAEGYAVGAAVLPACSVGAPHRRDRLWFVANSCRPTLWHKSRRGHDGQQEHVADADSRRLAVEWLAEYDDFKGPPRDLSDRCSEGGRWDRETLAHANHLGWHRGPSATGREERPSTWPECCREDVADPRRLYWWSESEPTGDEGRGEADRGGDISDAGRQGLSLSESEALLGEGWGQEGGAVAQCDWWAVEPDVGRVAHGIPARVGKLRALGNAIVPQVAEVFIRSVM